MEKSIRTASLLIRIGLAFVFAYAAWESLFMPENFLKYIPDFVQHMITPSYFLLAFGICEAVLVVWLLSGWKAKYAGIVSAFLLVSIVVFNTAYFPVLFRNIAIAFAALALTVLEER